MTLTLLTAIVVLLVAVALSTLILTLATAATRIRITCTGLIIAAAIIGNEPYLRVISLAMFLTGAIAFVISFACIEGQRYHAIRTIITCAAIGIVIFMYLTSGNFQPWRVYLATTAMFFFMLYAFADRRVFNG